MASEGVKSMKLDADKLQKFIEHAKNLKGDKNKTKEFNKILKKAFKSRIRYAIRPTSEALVSVTNSNSRRRYEVEIKDENDAVKLVEKIKALHTILYDNIENKLPGSREFFVAEARLKDYCFIINDLFKRFDSNMTEKREPKKTIISRIFGGSDIDILFALAVVIIILLLIVGILNLFNYGSHIPFNSAGVNVATVNQNLYS